MESELRFYSKLRKNVTHYLARKINVTYYRCNKLGHVIKKCRILKREHKKNGNETNTISNDGDVEIVFDKAHFHLVCNDTNLQ